MVLEVFYGCVVIVNIERVLRLASSNFPNEFRLDLTNSGFEIIEPDGRTFKAFSSRQWNADSFLAKNGNTIYVALVTARKPRRGSFSKLVREIESGGYRLAVISPLTHMEFILARWGFKPTRELIWLGVASVWRRGI